MKDIDKIIITIIVLIILDIIIGCVVFNIILELATLKGKINAIDWYLLEIL